MPTVDDLLPCPFCGGQPAFSRVEERDERRYMAMDVECCVSMSTGIGWNVYRTMSHTRIETELKTALVEKWNTRNTNEE